MRKCLVAIPAGSYTYVATSSVKLARRYFTFHIHALEKEMATHSSVLAWRISGTGEPDGLLSMGSNRVRHNCTNRLQEHLVVNVTVPKKRQQ